MTEQANARDLFRAAYEHRYTWDSNFPGYSADVELKQNEEIYTGHISIKPDMTVEVSGIDDEEVQQSRLHPTPGILLPTANGDLLRKLTATIALL